MKKGKKKVDFWPRTKTTHIWTLLFMSSDHSQHSVIIALQANQLIIILSEFVKIITRVTITYSKFPNKLPKNHT